ncbi:unnamed protein product [Polarella glacialis]|uniref:Uncharacterized protein n=1 Tax=Polarella glacialis TaxID=89957 RepID=A0A813EB01_POLGL|nr:unnamed protein product [Polarella glacialis]
MTEMQSFCTAVNGELVRPELQEAQSTILELQTQIEAERCGNSQMQAELLEARRLKNQEERDLVEFKAVRQKESEVQLAKMEAQQLRAEVEELQAQSMQLSSRGEQQKAVLKEKSEKIIELVRSLEQQGEQVRLLSDENNTLRLELGRDAEYLKVLPAPSDPMSYRCAAGALSEELASEEQRLREDLRSLAVKFPGLPSGGQGLHCSRWCELQINRVSNLHTSFLHRLQDYQKEFPEGVKVEFVTQTAEKESEWNQQDALMREASSEIQESEKVHSKRCEEHRLKITGERDSKVKQLLEQAERSQSKAEKQLLLHQAKLFGQRIDAQLERHWEEQRKDRDLRWTEHQQKRQDARQRMKDESLAMVQRTEDKASASSRFIDAASNKLAAVEDAWLRNSETAASLSASALKGGDLASYLRAARAATFAAANPTNSISAGLGLNLTEASFASVAMADRSQHTGLNLVFDQVEELLRSRADVRKDLRRDLEEQSRQQLRGCVEKFVQKEPSHQRTSRDEDEIELEYSQASAIIGMLRMRQHRHLSDALKRQFQDYLLVLRMCSLAASWLLPGASSAARCSEDLPPLPAELDTDGSSAKEREGAPVPAREDEDADDVAVESDFLYKSLCSKLLERALKLLSEMQREELLSLKRAYASEQRLALEHLCQLESSMVEKAVAQDIQEYELQIATRLFSDCEHHVNAEREQLASQVAEDVANHVASYRNQLQDEEQARVAQIDTSVAVARLQPFQVPDNSMLGRREGAQEVADEQDGNPLVLLLYRAIRRLRQEPDAPVEQYALLRVCDTKIERYDNTFATGVLVPQAPSAPSRPPSGRSRPLSAGRRHMAVTPAAPQSQPVKPRELPQHSEVPMSPRYQYMPQPAATGQALPWDSPGFGNSNQPASPSKGAGRYCGVAPASPKMPQFGVGFSDFGPDNRGSPEFGFRPSQEPLCDWPFDCSETQPAPPSMSPPRSAGGLSARSLSAPVTARLKPLDCLSPMKSHPVTAGIHDFQECLILPQTMGLASEQVACVSVQTRSGSADCEAAPGALAGFESRGHKMLSVSLSRQSESQLTPSVASSGPDATLLTRGWLYLTEDKCRGGGFNFPLT